MSNAKYNKLVEALTRRANEKGAKTKKGKSGQRKRGTKMLQVGGNDSVLRDHWFMVHNPCFATLAQSAYRGRAGIVQRFTSIITLNTGVNTGFVATLNPAAATGNITQFTDPTIATAAIVYNVALPGQAFLLANTKGSRVIGYCIDIDYIGTELNRSGMFYAGVVPGDAVVGGVGTIPDSLKQLLPNQTRTPDHQITQLWFPGVENEQYSLVGAGATSYTASNNSLLVIAEGMPAAVQVRLRITGIYEYTPLLGVGVAMPSPVSGYNPVGAYERLLDIGSKTNAFTHSFTEGLSTRANQYAARAGQSLVDVAAAGAGAYAVRAYGRRRGQGMANLMM